MLVRVCILSDLRMKEGPVLMHLRATTRLGPWLQYNYMMQNVEEARVSGRSFMLSSRFTLARKLCVQPSLASVKQELSMTQNFDALHTYVI